MIHIIKKAVTHIAVIGLLFTISTQTYSLTAGDSAPAILLPELEGQAAGNELIGIGNFRGKLVYLDFWASWCGPCRKSLPILNELRNQYNDQGFEVVAINVDENLKDALRFLNKYPVDYPVLLDPKGSSPQTYQVKGMPTAYLIDKNGVVIYKHQGFKNKDRKKIEALVKKYLAGK